MFPEDAKKIVLKVKLDFHVVINSRSKFNRNRKFMGVFVRAELLIMHFSFFHNLCIWSPLLIRIMRMLFSTCLGINTNMDSEFERSTDRFSFSKRYLREQARKRRRRSNLLAELRGNISVTLGIYGVFVYFGYR